MSETPPMQDITTPIAQEMQESYLTYAMSVIMARALPDVRDGLKPSQRRILVAMHDLGLRPSGKFRKCAKICGDTSGNYHPHGESVIYPTLVRMGQPWAMRHQLVDPQGNFGSIDADPPAAMRYTEARLAAPADLMLDDIDKETVEFEPNFDETRQEPVYLPSKFPNLLVNGGEGIAVGMATRLLPHNLGEICDAVCAYLDDPATFTPEKLLEYVQGPDLPTGGIICGRRGIAEAYATGRGSITVRGKYHVEESGNRTNLVIDEIPYGVLLRTIKDKIVDSVQGGLIKGIADLRDESGRKQMVRLVLVLKRDADPEVVVNQLWKYTPLQTNLHAMNIVLVNRVPKTLNMVELIEQFVMHREDVIRRRTQYLLRKARQRAHILEGLILAVADIDEIIEIIKTSPDVPTARQRLMEKALRLSEQATVRKLLPEKFAERAIGEDQFLTRTQADAILNMQLRRLTGLEIEQLAKEYGDLTEKIEGYELILSDRRRIFDIIAEDMREMKDKHANPRRTEVSGDVSELSIEELITEEQVVVTFSHEGYVKRVPLDTFRSQGRGGRGVRGTEQADGDFIEQLRVASTHDHLLVFTNRGRCYWLRVFDLPSASRTSRGRALANFITMQPDERWMAVLTVSEFEEAYVFFTTERGLVKKTPLSAFSRPRSNGIIAIGLEATDSLIRAVVTTGEQEVIIGTRAGMAIRFNESDVRPMGRTARGVRGIALRDDDTVIDMAAIESGHTLLTVCERGLGKRTEIDEYRLTRRGAKGVINVRVTERNGPVVALRAVHDDDALMFITSSGILLRTEVSQTRTIGRATQGVRLMRVGADDRIVAVARIVKEEEQEQEVAAQTGEAPPQRPADLEETPEAKGPTDGPGAAGDDSAAAEGDTGA